MPRSRDPSLLILTSLASLISLAGCGGVPWNRGEPRKPITHFNTSTKLSWTSTTLEAASTPKYRKVLAQARPKTIVGEVVDVSCFLQLGKRGEAHIPCGQKCVRNGQQIGIITDHDHLYLIFPEEHHPRRDGQVNIRDRFAELMGTWVQVTGMATNVNGYRALFVETLPVEK